MAPKRRSDSIVIRRLHRSDHEKICGHFRRLDPVSRRSRFCGSLAEGGIDSYARQVFRHDSVVCGAFLDCTLRGIVELRGILHFMPSSTEAAFSVESDWQNIGIGDALFERIVVVARNRGVRSIRLMCLSENSRMRHLAAKHGACLDLDREVAEAFLPLRWPTPASLAAEIIVETRALARCCSPHAPTD